jgi:hypothetical protein
LAVVGVVYPKINILPKHQQGFINNYPIYAGELGKYGSRDWELRP